MFNAQARELIRELLESFAQAGEIPIAMYEIDRGGIVTLIAHADRSHFPKHCQTLWKIEGGEARCRQDMLERASEGFASDRPHSCLCHAGLTTEIHPITVDGEIVAVLQFGAFLNADRDDENERLERHRRLMKDLAADARLAEQIKSLLLDETLRRPDSDRAWLKRALPLVIERVIYRHLTDLSQELRGRKQEESIRKLAYHDVQLRLQAALAQAENHSEELKDPTSKSWYLRQSAEELVTSIELAGTVLQNLMQGEYLPENYQFEQLDLREIILSAISLAQPMAERRNIVIRPLLGPENMRIMLQASPIHLQQAFNNLIHNAVKYSYRASEYGGRQVTIRGSYAEQGYRIVIENYGIGILESEYEKVFEPGYKGVLRQKERRTGSGLGLPLTRQIVEKHRGKIGVCSEPMGDPEREQSSPYLTRFTVWLPLTQPSQAGPAMMRLVKGGKDGK